MFEKLKATEEKFEDISNRLTDPEVIGDNGLYARLMKEYKSLSPVVEKYREYCSYVKTEQEAQEMLDESGADRELKDLARAELDEARENIASVSEELKILLIPKDPNDDKDVIIEVRAGTGGEEAALFGADLLRMYTRYAERHGYKAELMNENYPEKGGVKEVVLSLQGKGAYSGKEKRVILCVARKQQGPAIEEIVKGEDKDAFMIISSANEIYGEGYKNIMSDKL